MAGIWCPEIRTLQGEYKPATDRVLGWIKNVSNVRNASVNHYITLAEKLVRNGTQMPEDILQDLYKGIDRRQQAEDALAKHGGADHDTALVLPTVSTDNTRAGGAAAGSCIAERAISSGVRATSFTR
ncbi:hypothetical protein LTS15_009676 [Exophiala xenobiotica]|nr:hypothetical protein LTS15_009676 [Exophiala xenobiotica]